MVKINQRLYMDEKILERFENIYNCIETNFGIQLVKIFYDAYKENERNPNEMNQEIFNIASHKVTLYRNIQYSLKELKEAKEDSRKLIKKYCRVKTNVAKEYVNDEIKENHILIQELQEEVTRAKQQLKL